MTNAGQSAIRQPGQDASASTASLLPLFSCREAYVYQIPPATTVGHRAETWNVNKWFAEVGVRVAAADEHCTVQLEDLQSGELFAECPVPTDRPLITAVEPVIDSSRYFVLRIEDAASKRHAFIGLGFRERAEASDFNAALHEHQQYVKRKRLAEAQRQAYEARERAAAEGEASGSEGGAAGAAALQDLSLKPGERLTLKISLGGAASTTGCQGGGAGGGGFVSSRTRSGGLPAGDKFSLLMQGQGRTVAPPPCRRSGELPMSVSPSHSAGEEVARRPSLDDGGSSSSDEEVVSTRLHQLRLQERRQQRAAVAGQAAQESSSGTDAAALAAPAPAKQQQQQQQQDRQAQAQQDVAGGATVEEDDFGDFVS